MFVEFLVEINECAMRLDKFLQLSRLIKQRSLAKEACERELVTVNGMVSKPSRELTVGQRVRIRYARKLLEVEVLLLPSGNMSKKLAPDLYRVLTEETLEVDPWNG